MKELVPERCLFRVVGVTGCCNFFKSEAGEKTPPRIISTSSYSKARQEIKVITRRGGAHTEKKKLKREKTSDLLQLLILTNIQPELFEHHQLK